MIKTDENMVGLSYNEWNSMRVAIIWFVNEFGEILLSKRADSLSSDAGKWGPSVSGKIEPGETADETAVREAYEELGVPETELHPVFLHEEMYDHKDGQERIFEIYYSKVNKNVDQVFKLEPKEVQATKWVSLGELSNLLRYPSGEIIISDASKLWDRILLNLEHVTNRGVNV